MPSIPSTWKIRTPAPIGQTISTAVCHTLKASVLGSGMEFPTITGVATRAVPEVRIVKLDASVNKYRQHDCANNIAQQFLV